MSSREKRRWARKVVRDYGARLLADPTIRSLLSRYREAVEATWREMEAVGVVRECTHCAVEDGGSCCGSGIEDRFDVVLILVNYLVGRDVPEQRFDPTGCFFLGPKGCLLFARHTICVNYICKRLQENIPTESLQGLQERIGEECDAVFMLEEALKSWLRHVAIQMNHG